MGSWVWFPVFGQELCMPMDLIFGPSPKPDDSAEPGLDYLYKVVEQICELHEFAQQALTMAGVQQKQAHDTRSIYSIIGESKVWELSNIVMIVSLLFKGAELKFRGAWATPQRG